MRPLKEKVSITLDNDIVKRLKEEAEKDERTFSQYINLVLKEHIKKLDSCGEKQENMTILKNI